MILITQLSLHKGSWIWNILIKVTLKFYTHSSLEVAPSELMDLKQGSLLPAVPKHCLTLCIQPTIRWWSGMVKGEVAFWGETGWASCYNYKKPYASSARGRAVSLKQNSPAFITAEAPAILCFLLNPLGNYRAHLAKVSHDIPNHRAERARTPSSAAWGLFCAVSHSLLLAASAASIVPEQPFWLLASRWPCPTLNQGRKNRVDVADHNLWPKGNVFNMKIINLFIGDKYKNCFSDSKLPGSSCSGAKQDLMWARNN